MRPPPPTSPIVLPHTPAPIRCIDCAPGKMPSRTSLSPSTTRRAAARRIAKCRSAVASVTIGGTTVTAIRQEAKQDVVVANRVDELVLGHDMRRVGIPFDFGEALQPRDRTRGDGL